MPPRTRRACLLQLEPYGVQAKVGELSEAQAPQARQSPRPKNTRGRREKNKTQVRTPRQHGT